MLFNNPLASTALLSTPYLSGSIIFQGSHTLYSPTSNLVTSFDLLYNRTQLLGFQTEHNIAHVRLDFSGTILIAVDVSGRCVVYNVKGSFVIGEFNFGSQVACCDFSQDGKLFAVGMGGGFAVYVTPAPQRSFEPFLLLKRYKNRHSAPLTSLNFTPDSRFLFTCGEDFIVHLNNLFPLPKTYNPISLEVHRYSIIKVAMTQNMDYVYTFDKGSNLYVWKWVEELSEGYQNLVQAKRRKRDQIKGIRSQQTKPVPIDSDEEQTDRVKSEDTDWKTLDQQLSSTHPHLSPFERRTCRGRYILETKHIVTEPNSYLKRVYFKPENGFLCLAYSNGKFSVSKLIDTTLEHFRSFTVGDNRISSLTVNEDCSWIGLGIKSQGQIIVWEWKSQSYVLNQRGYLHESEVAASNGAKLVAVGSVEGTVRFWNSEQGFCLATLQEHHSKVTGLKFSNRQTLFSSSTDGTVSGYDATRFKKFRTFKPDTECQLMCLQIDQSGDVVYAGAFDPYEIYAWNIQTSNLLQIVRGHEGPISCLGMASQILVTGSWDRTIKLHDIYSRRLNVETLEQGSQLTAIAVHPYGNQVACTTMKGEIYLWDTSTNDLNGIINCDLVAGRIEGSKMSAQNSKNNRYLKCLTYSPCGKYLIGGGKSPNLMVYDIAHRMVLKRIPLTKNRDFQGVLEQLNSKYIKDGVSTYKLDMSTAADDSDNERQAKHHLPGSKKLDSPQLRVQVSQLRLQLQTEVRHILMPNTNQIIAVTSFGVFVLETELHINRSVFNPYELTEEMTPSQVVKLLHKKLYGSALSVALKLNFQTQEFSIDKILKKIPVSSIAHTVSNMDVQSLVQLLEKLCNYSTRGPILGSQMQDSLNEQGENQNRVNIDSSPSSHSLTYRTLLWVSHILPRQLPSIPSSLLGACDHLQQQLELMGESVAALKLGVSMGKMQEVQEE